MTFSAVLMKSSGQESRASAMAQLAAGLLEPAR